MHVYKQCSHDMTLQGFLDESQRPGSAVPPMDTLSTATFLSQINIYPVKRYFRFGFNISAGTKQNDIYNWRKIFRSFILFK